MEDGATHQEIFKLGRVGDWGRRPGNCHRDLLTSFCPQILLPEPFEVQVPCLHPKTSLEKGDGAGLFLPHLLFSHLGENYFEFFEQVFCLTDSSLEKFWSAVEAVEDDRIVGHPMCLEKHWKKKNIPLFVYGDGVEYHSRDSLLVFTWGCMLGNLPSLKQHFLLAAFPKTCTVKGTWPTIWSWLRWSLEALGKGYRPKEGPDGAPLEKGSPFLEKQGQPLHHKGLRAQVFSIQGDHEFFCQHPPPPPLASPHALLGM